MEDGNSTEKQRVNALTRHNNKPRANKHGGGKSRDNAHFARHKYDQICRNCGGKWPHRSEKPCTAKGKTCHACGKQNHFQKMCRLKPNKAQSAHSCGNVNTTEIFEFPI